MFLLMQSGVMAGVAAAVLSALNIGPPDVLWSAAFPVLATCMSLFFLKARYEDLVLQISLRQIIGPLIRFYTFLFAFDPQTDKGTPMPRHGVD
jgi:hypothetical protein